MMMTNRRTFLGALLALLPAWMKPRKKALHGFDTLCGYPVSVMGTPKGRNWIHDFEPFTAIAEVVDITNHDSPCPQFLNRQITFGMDFFPDEQEHDMRFEALRHVFRDYDRVAIAGGPKTGKSTLAVVGEECRLRAGHSEGVIIHTDASMNMPWADQPFDVIKRCKAAGLRFIVEGVQVGRALRKGLEVDAVIWLSEPKTQRTKSQVSMAKGASTIFEGWAKAAEIPIFRE